jgi:hydroxymethylpyrimidine/phosphomethylpyrimidine kinase
MGKIGVSIAGLDPSGGAGVLLDTAVFKKEGVYPMGVITAILPQNSKGVTNYIPLSPNQILKSLEKIEEDFIIGGIKIGVIGKLSIAKIIYDFIKDRDIPIVLDPIFVSGTGFKLYNNGLLEFFRDKLISEVSLITPNIKEMELLSGEKIKSEEGAVKIAVSFSSIYKVKILLKGGHLKGNDFLVEDNTVKKIEGKLIDKDVHGTGCFLSSMILSKMINEKDNPLFDIIVKSKEILFEKIKKSIKLGNGKKYYMEV